MNEKEKMLTGAYYWLSMFKAGAIVESVALERVKEELFEQPQLNENQQIVLEYLKYRFGKYDDVFVRSIFSPIDDLISECLDDDINDAGGALSLKEEAQVLQAFSQWALEQEEE